MNPIGVGFIDLNSEGLFHLERLCLRDEFRCVAGWDAARDLAAVSHARLLNTSESPHDVIGHPEVSLVWIGPHAPASLITAALQADKQVLMGLPVGVSAHDWRDWTSAGSRICVAALHRWDGRFQMAKSVVRGDGLGTLVDVRRCSRQYVPAMNGRPKELNAAGLKWFEILDELLLLVPHPVTAITARPTWRNRGGEFSTDPSGLSVWVTFATGCQAWLELDRQSLAPVETGWVLDGTQAGFANGLRLEPGSDHELIDIPVEEQTTDQDAFYNALVETIRTGAEFPVTLESVQRVVELMETINAA